MLRSLAKRHLTPEKFDAFNRGALKTIEARQEDRNIVAHGTWGTLQPDNVPIAMVVRRKSDVGQIAAETFPKERMNAINDSLILCLEAIKVLITELASSTPEES